MRHLLFINIMKRGFSVENKSVKKVSFADHVNVGYVRDQYVTAAIIQLFDR